MENKQGAILTKKEANERIRKNLLENGTFFQSKSIIERPYIIGANYEKQPVIKDDFIHLMLNVRDNGFDPRWIEADSLPAGTQLKPDAEGVTLDKITVYPARSVEKIEPYQPLELEEIHVDYASDLIESYLEAREFDKSDLEKPFEVRLRNAAEYIANEIAGDSETKLLDTEVFVYLLKADCGIQASATVKYADRLAELMKNNENLIFQSFQRAEENIEKLKKMNDKQLQNLARESFENLNKPFKDLYVHYYISEHFLKNPKTGETFKEDTRLQGEEAYLFLAEVNRADKEMVMKDRPYYHKTNFSFRYGEYDHGEIRIDLGDMELHNCTSIAEAMKRRCSLFTNGMLCDRDERRMFIQKEKFDNRTVKEGELLEWADEMLTRIDCAFEKFKKEEDRYLKNHPEIEKINQIQCDTRLFRCPTAKKMEDIPYYWTYASIQKPEKYGVDEPGFVVEVARRISLETQEMRNMKPFYTMEERERLKELQYLYVERSSFFEGDYNLIGAKAMQLIHSAIIRDKLAYQKIARERKMQAPHATEVLYIKFHDFKRKIKIGIGKLELGNKTSITDSLRYISGSLSKAEAESLNQLEELEKLYYKYHYYNEISSLRYSVEVVPDLVITPMMDKPGKGADARNILQYYKLYAELNGHKDSLPYMVQAMRKDKLTKPMIIRVLQADGIENAREKVNQLIPKTERKRKY